MGPSSLSSIVKAFYCVMHIIAFLQHLSCDLAYLLWTVYIFYTLVIAIKAIQVNICMLQGNDLWYSVPQSCIILHL